MHGVAVLSVFVVAYTGILYKKMVEIALWLKTIVFSK